ncbi:hypothetical protein KM043_018010 [Ampulex compressa]|nr:hypothetical protein KM043_018010 [Ampulex compressa]
MSGKERSQEAERDRGRERPPGGKGRRTHVQGLPSVWSKKFDKVCSVIRICTYLKQVYVGRSVMGDKAVVIGKERSG